MEALADMAVASKTLNGVTALMTRRSRPTLEEWVAPMAQLDEGAVAWHAGGGTRHGRAAAM
jgi:hypothetical protein